MNAALPKPPEAAIQQIFLNIVDTFTEWHLRLLVLFNDPNSWAKSNNHKFPQLISGGLSPILESAYPQLSGHRDFYDQI